MLFFVAHIETQKLMSKQLRPWIIVWLTAFFLGATLSSCAILRGDPRKNCNHPQHGQYMQEKRSKKMGF